MFSTRAILVPLAGLASAVGVVSAAATTPPHDLPRSYLFTPAGKVTPLDPGATYSASQFPIRVTVTPPSPGWAGTQWKSGRHYFHGGAPPNHGWIHLARGPVNAVPRGLISIMAAYARTPSVAATVNVLRTRGHGAAYDETSPITLDGYAGVQFDGRITGGGNVDHIGHFFIPFSPRSHAARYYADEYGVFGDVFRVIVLGVRGHTVVIYIENAALSQAAFPTFLEAATKILGSLRFQKGT